MARLLESDWVDNEFTADLLHKVGGDRRLAIVIYGTLFSDAIDWLARPIPALEGATPLNALKTEQGIRRVKECLMRFPR